VEGSLESADESSNGGGATESSAQVRAVNAGSLDRNGGNQTSTETTIVGSPHYVTVTGTSVLHSYNVE